VSQKYSKDWDAAARAQTTSIKYEAAKRHGLIVEPRTPNALILHEALYVYLHKYSGSPLPQHLKNDARWKLGLKAFGPVLSDVAKTYNDLHQQASQRVALVSSNQWRATAVISCLGILTGILVAIDYIYTR
jgi:hypothetical protein